MTTETRASDGPNDTPAPGPWVRTPGGRVVLATSSLALMAPWPGLGILLLQGRFDHWNESCLLFGGITGIPIIMLSFIGLPESVLLGLILLTWLAILLVPWIWSPRRLASWRAVLIVLAIQLAFSVAQALVGALMILGKSI